MAPTFYSGRTIDGKNIQLSVTNIDDKTVEFIVENLNFSKDRNSEVVMLSLTFTVYFLVVVLQLNIFLIIDIIFVILLIVQVYFLINFVNYEKIIFTKDLALQSQTRFTFGRKKNIYISADNIESVIIRDTISSYRAVYMLVCMTKGDLYQTKPIIPIMNVLNPNSDTLKIIYKEIRNKMKESPKDD